MVAVNTLITPLKETPRFAKQEVGSDDNTFPLSNTLMQSLQLGCRMPAKCSLDCKKCKAKSIFQLVFLVHRSVCVVFCVTVLSIAGA